MLVEQDDVTDSSDQLDDYYEKDPEIKVAILESLMKLTKSNPDHLTKMLLKGFYTCNRSEMGNPPLMMRENDIIQKLEVNY